MSAQFPPPQTVLFPPVEDGNARRSRRGRISIGVGLLVVCAIGTVGMVWVYSQLFPVIEFLDEGQRSETVGLAAMGLLLLLALLGAGIWNIAARHTWAMAPLVTAVVVSGVGLIFAVINGVDMLISTGKPTSLWAAWLYLALILQAIRLLRLKPNPVSLRSQPQAP